VPFIKLFFAECNASLLGIAGSLQWKEAFEYTDVESPWRSEKKQAQVWYDFLGLTKKKSFGCIARNLYHFSSSREVLSTSYILMPTAGV
jgi:hypothetical protein